MTGRSAPDVLPGATTERAHRLAAAVRDACIRAASDGYEQAGTSGLCTEGRWEIAVDAMRSLDLDAVINDTTLQAGSPATEDHL